MLHYENDPRHAAQSPPPACPKCGSHGVEVVGRSDDGRAVTVRCNACDERSAVIVDRRAIDRASDADTMTDEIEAIRTVGRVLAQLPDAAARVRVMRWAAERFRTDTTFAVAAAAAPTAIVSRVNAAVDPTLSMDGLQELFRARTKVGDELTLDASPLMMESEPVAELVPHVEQVPHVEEPPHADSMIHSFVTDFQRLADDCQNVFAVPISSTSQ